MSSVQINLTDSCIDARVELYINMTIRYYFNRVGKKDSVKKLCFVFFCLLLTGLSARLYAQNEDAAGKNLITGLSVSGLKRTRLSTAERPLRKFIGIEADRLDQNEVWAAIMDTGILEPLLVEIRDAETGGSVLAVTVREKWSIFPIPILMAGSGGVSAGGAIFDANAFGLNDKFFLTGIFRQGGWTAAAGYVHAVSGGRLPGWNGMASFTRGEREDVDQNNKKLRHFDWDSISVTAGLNFNLLENSNLLSASPHIAYNEKILRNSEKTLNSPGADLRLFGAGLGLSLRRSGWDGYLLSQEEVSLRYSFHTSANGYSHQSFNLKGIWEKSLVPGFRLVTRTGLVFDPHVPVLFESAPSGAQVDILPRSFSARRYAGASAGLEKYLFKINAGTLSLASSYQIVYSRGSVLGGSYDHGFAGKLSFYLSRLAIPALGLGVAYNVKEHYSQGIFSLGMTF